MGEEGKGKSKLLRQSNQVDPGAISFDVKDWEKNTLEQQRAPFRTYKIQDTCVTVTWIAK